MSELMQLIPRPSASRGFLVRSHTTFLDPEKVRPMVQRAIKAGIITLPDTAPPIPANPINYAEFRRVVGNAILDGAIVLGEVENLIIPHTPDPRKGRSKELRSAECCICHGPFETYDPNRITCSDECAKKRAEQRVQLKKEARTERLCKTCGVGIGIGVKVIYCDPCRELALVARDRRAIDKRRAKSTKRFNDLQSLDMCKQAGEWLNEREDAPHHSFRNIQYGRKTQVDIQQGK